jgi:hypothetical protein
MANYDFNEDIHVGEHGEQVVVDDLRTFNMTFVSDNKDYRYDIVMEKNGKRATYEVKTDVFCTPRYNNDTGNMFIEFHSRGKDSGVAVTEADWFVMYYKYLKEIWYIKTDALKKLIADNNFRISEYSGDQGSNTKGYLIPRKEFKDWFIVRSPK